jgi:hypothetical protein
MAYESLESRTAAPVLLVVTPGTGPGDVSMAGCPDAHAPPTITITTAAVTSLIVTSFCQGGRGRLPGGKSTG